MKYTYAYNPYGELTKGSYGQVMFLFNGQYVSKNVGNINSGIIIGVTVVDWIKKKIKECIDEKKKKMKR